MRIIKISKNFHLGIQIRIFFKFKKTVKILSGNREKETEILMATLRINNWFRKIPELYACNLKFFISYFSVWNKSSIFFVLWKKILLYFIVIYIVIIYKNWKILQNSEYSDIEYFQFFNILISNKQLLFISSEFIYN